MEGGVDHGAGLHYSRLSYRRKYYRTVWGTAFTLPALIAAQRLGWFPNGALSFGGLPHAEALGWGLIGLVAVTSAARAAYTYSRWQAGTRREGAASDPAEPGAAPDPAK